MTKKTRCPYCNRHLLLKTFEEPKRLYYDSKSDQWCVNLKESGNSYLNFSENSDTMVTGSGESGGASVGPSFFAA